MPENNTFENSILDNSNAGAPLFLKHVAASNYGCLVCKSSRGSAFDRLEIKDGLAQFFYHCNSCGGTNKSQQFSCDEIKLLMRNVSMGEQSDMYECFVMVHFYPSKCNDFGLYQAWCRALKAPERSRWQDALRKIVGIS